MGFRKQLGTSDNWSEEPTHAEHQSRCNGSSSSTDCWYEDDGDSSNSSSTDSVVMIAHVRKRLVKQRSSETLQTAKSSVLDASFSSLLDWDDESFGDWAKQNRNVQFALEKTTTYKYEPPSQESYDDLYYTVEELKSFQLDFEKELEEASEQFSSKETYRSNIARERTTTAPLHCTQ